MANLLRFLRTHNARAREWLASDPAEAAIADGFFYKAPKE
jgi:hypothetical protein